MDQRLIFAAALASLAAATPAIAQDAGATTPPAAPALDVGGDHITVAGAGVYLPDYEGSNNYRWTPAPAAIGSIKGYSFTLVGNRASIDLVRAKPGPGFDFELGPIGVVNFNRSSLKRIDDPRIRALGKLGTAIELGGYVGIGKTGVITSPYDKLSFTVSYRHDVSGVHDSGVVTPTVNYLTPLSRKAAVAVFGSAEHAGRGYARTYESVSLAQSLASGLPVYDAHAGWKSYTVGALATVSITGDLLHGLKLVAGGTYTRELGSFGYSPLTRIAGTPNQWLGAAGVAFTF